MRLLHPQTIKILANHPEFPKTHLIHAWSEVFKYLASSKKHPKMFLPRISDYGIYLAYLYQMCGFGTDVKLDRSKVDIRGGELVIGWKYFFRNPNRIKRFIMFDDNYLFSDAVSLYFKGINIFPDIFGDEWRKYVPVESLKEIKRQIDKTLTK